MKKARLFSKLLSALVILSMVIVYGTTPMRISATGNNTASSEEENGHGAMAGAPRAETTITWLPQGKVVLNNGELQNGEFNFSIEQIESENPRAPRVLGGASQEVQNEATGDLPWSFIVYNQHSVNKTYYYRMKQLNPTTPKEGVKIDRSVVIVTVKVLPGDTADQLKLDVKYKEEGQQLMSEPTFVNKMDQSAVFVPASIVTLDGRDMKESEFKFVLEQIQSEDPKAEVVPGGVSETVGNSPDGRILWGPLEYKESDVGKSFYYRIQQLIPEFPTESDIDYDPSVFILTVNVSKDHQTGKLELQHTYKIGSEQLMDAPTFVNVVMQSKTLEPAARVSLDGGNLKDGEFYFG